MSEKPKERVLGVAASCAKTLLQSWGAADGDLLGQVQRGELTANEVVEAFGAVVRERLQPLEPARERICLGCKHSVMIGLLPTVWGCMAEGKTNPVDGEPQGPACKAMRAEGAPCGPAGKLWEP